MDRINRTGWKQTFWKEPTGHHRPTAVGQQCPHWVAFSKLYSTQSLMLELSQELLGQTTKGCPGRRGRPDGGQAIPTTQHS